MDEIEPRSADRFLLGEATNIDHARAHVRTEAGSIYDRDHIAGVLDKRTEAFPFLLGPLFGSDVGEGADPPRYPSLMLGDPLARHEDDACLTSVARDLEAAALCPPGAFDPLSE